VFLDFDWVRLGDLLDDGLGDDHMLIVLVLEVWTVYHVTVTGGPVTVTGVKDASLFVSFAVVRRRRCRSRLQRSVLLGLVGLQLHSANDKCAQSDGVRHSPKYYRHRYGNLLSARQWVGTSYVNAAMD